MRLRLLNNELCARRGDGADANVLGLRPVLGDGTRLGGARLKGVPYCAHHLVLPDHSLCLCFALKEFNKRRNTDRLLLNDLELVLRLVLLITFKFLF